jgi:V8-like Glu-specific endopeptidase
LSVHRNCAISERPAGTQVLVHTCDTTRGGSGSPLLAKDADGYSLIGIASGHQIDGTAKRSLAVSPDAVLDAIATAHANSR